MRAGNGIGRRRDSIHAANCFHPPLLEADLQASWERVFDLNCLKRAKLWGPIDAIQGVTESVLIGEVRRVDEFVAR